MRQKLPENVHLCFEHPLLRKEIFGEWHIKGAVMRREIKAAEILWGMCQSLLLAIQTGAGDAVQFPEQEHQDNESGWEDVSVHLQRSCWHAKMKKMEVACGHAFPA